MVESNSGCLFVKNRTYNYSLSANGYKVIQKNQEKKFSTLIVLNFCFPHNLCSFELMLLPNVAKKIGTECCPYSS
jgi:hypothetical protein